eukprot:TRINITY_DN2330_c0_g1_i2.p1 TRINITY_DN2330_c0_g1~~TRINITY_DN2330_c0_g1_i2.p1  ORF type:complete len:241 (+),score=71.28 TRINITY_DN2330_c0_g1_i2:312-1034(+)
MDEEENERYAQSVLNFEFDRHLGAYPTDDLQKWKNLSSFITVDIFQKLQPIDKKISSIQEGPRKIPFYSKIPEKPPQNATAEERTRFYMEKSSILDSILDKNHNNQEKSLLGEIQFSFVTFLIGQSYEGFEQWKQLVGIITCSERSFFQRKEFYYDFIAVLHFQLEQVPKDFFVDILSGNNFLRKAFEDFFAIVDDPKTDNQIKKRADNLKHAIENRFGLIIQTGQYEEDGEDAPVIVEE